jgi:hypothetical protein
MKDLKEIKDLLKSIKDEVSWASLFLLILCIQGCMMCSKL